MLHFARTGKRAPLVAPTRMAEREPTLRWKQESAHHRSHSVIDDFGALSLRPSRRASFKPGPVYATVEVVDP